MAGSHTFSGSTIFHPGGLSRVDTSQLTPIGPTATGIVQLVGEADNGPPGITIIDDPVLAGSIYKTGPLADAVRLAFDPSADPRIPGGAFRAICYKTNASTQSSSQIPGAVALIADTAAAGSTTTVVNLTTGGLTASAHIGRWFRIGTETRRITANAAGTVTVSPGFSTAPIATTVVKILQSQMIVTSRDYGANQISFEVEPGVTSNTRVITVAQNGKSEQSPELGGTSFLNLVYKGGPIPLQGVGPQSATLLPITAASTTTVTATFTVNPSANQYDNLVLEFSDGKRRKIASHTTIAPNIVFTLDAATLLTSSEATAAVGQTVTVRNVTSATASIVGLNGVATQLTSVVAPTADNLAITFTLNQSLKSLVDQINGSSNYTATIPAGVNGDTTLMKSFDFGTRNTAVDVRFDSTIDPTNKGSFRRDLQAEVDWLNNFSQYLTAVKATAATSEGSEVPDVTGGVVATVGDAAIYLISGARGSSTNSSFQTGFDALLNVRANHIVPLVSQDLVNEGFGSSATYDSVQAQLGSHIALCNTTAKNEKGGYMGFHGTKTAYIQKLNNANNTDIQICAQQPTVLNVSGTLTTQPEWALAVMAAGMRSGAPEVGEPLTFKTLKITGLTNDSSWSTTSTTDVNQILAAGGLIAEQTTTGTFRWVRDVTSYVADTNIALTDGNMREEARFISYDLRKSIEDQFTGLKAKVATIVGVRTFVVNKMALYLENGIITASLDENDNFVKLGWRKLRCFISGNVLKVRIEVFLTAGVVFETEEIVVLNPRLSA